MKISKTIVYLLFKMIGNIITLLITYAILAFINYELYPDDWGSFTRFILVVATVISVVKLISAFIDLFNLIKYRNY